MMMKKILFINDGSDASVMAAKNVMHIAQQHHADILIANLKKKPKQVLVTAGRSGKQGLPVQELEQDLNFDLFEATLDKFVPAINELDASSLVTSELADVINGQNIWMVVRGYATDSASVSEIGGFCSILSRIGCPLLLLPDKGGIISFERIAYLTDLRYSQLNIVRFLASFGAPFNAHILLAHLAAKGLPDMEQTYAKSLFTETIGSIVRYEKLGFDNIKEKQTQKVLDVLVHGMQNELLVMVNNHLHCDEVIELFKGRQEDIPPAVPFLIFPY